MGDFECYRLISYPVPIMQFALALQIERGQPRLGFFFVAARNPQLRAKKSPSMDRDNVRQACTVQNEQHEGHARQNDETSPKPWRKPCGRNAAEP